MTSSQASPSLPSEETWHLPKRYKYRKGDYHYLKYLYHFISDFLYCYIAFCFQQVFTLSSGLSSGLPIALRFVQVAMPYGPGLGTWRASWDQDGTPGLGTRAWHQKNGGVQQNFWWWWWWRWKHLEFMVIFRPQLTGSVSGIFLDKSTSEKSLLESHVVSRWVWLSKPFPTASSAPIRCCSFGQDLFLAGFTNMGFWLERQNLSWSEGASIFRQKDSVGYILSLIWFHGSNSSSFGSPAQERPQARGDWGGEVRSHQRKKTCDTTE